MMAETEEINHRKLIRPSLTAMKDQLEEKRRRKSPQRDAPQRNAPHGNALPRNEPSRNASQRNSSQRNAPPRNARQKSGPPRGKRSTPADHTNAESFYFVKQMQNQTPMVLVLTDGEEVCGTIEWYDRSCLKIRRDDEVNLLVYKDSVKYLYKSEETAEPNPQEVSAQEAAPQESDLADEDVEDEDEPNGNIAV